MIQVTVTKLAGETGLRLPGSRYFLPEGEALKLEARGLVTTENRPLLAMASSNRS